MPLKKIEEPGEALRKEKCIHPEHEPPKHQVLTSGTYEYECPGCGQRVTFTVSGDANRIH